MYKQKCYGHSSAILHIVERRIKGNFIFVSGPSPSNTYTTIDKGMVKLTSAARRHPSQSRTEILCENPGASDTAPKLRPAMSGPKDLRFAEMRLLPSVPVPWPGLPCCCLASSGPGLLPIHVTHQNRQPRSEHLPPAPDAHGCCDNLYHSTWPRCLWRDSDQSPKRASLRSHAFPARCSDMPGAETGQK